MLNFKNMNNNKQDIVQTWNKYRNNPSIVFLALSVFSLVCLLFVLFVTHGKAFSHFFYSDGCDTGMDFFHSIEYVRGKSPYEIFNTVYPPLANLFFLCIYRLIPVSVSNNWTYDFSESVAMRRTELDLRTYQSCAVMFILFILFTALLVFLIINRYASRKGIKYAEFLSIGFIFSYGMLYAYERGNIVILAAAFSLFFAANYQSDNKIIREMALISLAIAAGLKIYPAFLGVLLIKEKNIPVILRTVLYGVLSIILPCFAFNEGLGAIPMWLEILFNFGSSSSNNPWFSNGIPNAIANGAHLIDIVFGTEFAYISYKYVGIIIALIFIIMAFFMKKSWQSALALTFAMLFQSQGTYFYCMSLVPLLLFLGEEKSLNRKNIIPFIVMMCMILPFPILYVSDKIYPRSTIIHIAMACYFIWCLIESIKILRKSNVDNLTGNVLNND